MPVEIRNVKYTTLDKAITFTFDFVQTPTGAWRAYIRSQPPYAGRPEGAAQSHRLSDHRGQYVCWAPEPRTLDDAKGAARAWADATQEYLRSGTFPAPGPDRPVPDLSTSAAWEFRHHVGLIPDPIPVRPAPEEAPPPAAPLQVLPSRRSGLMQLLSNRRDLP